jgi:hypothetical protein
MNELQGAAVMRLQGAEMMSCRERQQWIVAGRSSSELWEYRWSSSGGELQEYRWSSSGNGELQELQMEQRQKWLAAGAQMEQQRRWWAAGGAAAVMSCREQQQWIVAEILRWGESCRWSSGEYAVALQLGENSEEAAGGATVSERGLQMVAATISERELQVETATTSTGGLQVVAAAMSARELQVAAAADMEELHWSRAEQKRSCGGRQQAEKLRWRAAEQEQNR